MTDEHLSLWALVSKLERQAANNWRATFARDEDLEGALANGVYHIQTTVTRKRSGNISVTVSFLGVLEHTSHVEYFFLQRAGNRMWKVAAA